MHEGATRQRTALVTGASSGFGLLTAVELARAGWRVFAGVRDLGRAAALREASVAAEVEVAVLALDVTAPATIAAALAEIDRQAGGVDLLVNNAGIGLGGFFEDVSDAELREIFATNFFAAAAMTRAVLPGMRARRWGRIINVSSINGRVAVPGLSAYNATKFALEGLSAALRLELKPFNIFVSIVAPGTYKTDIFTRNRRVAARAGAADSPYAAASARYREVIERHLAESRADPRDVARLIARIAAADRPGLRYQVGTDARTMAALEKLLPAALLEALLERAFAPALDALRPRQG